MIFWPCTLFVSHLLCVPRDSNKALEQKHKQKQKQKQKQTRQKTFFSFWWWVMVVIHFWLHYLILPYFGGPYKKLFVKNYLFLEKLSPFELPTSPLSQCVPSSFLLIQTVRTVRTAIFSTNNQLYRISIRMQQKTEGIKLKHKLVWLNGKIGKFEMVFVKTNKHNSILFRKIVNAQSYVINNDFKQFKKHF